ncbi:hypothetical protein [Haloferula sargassicola]|uniref:Uncharacterized protein n=1 Tax=Haloferula sargassicola TaxID=490096 RepID=A0ABP9USQ7_9BACT
MKKLLETKAVQRGTHTLASGLSVVAQRAPLLKEAGVLAESVPSLFRLAAPLGIHFLTTHAVSGASTTVKPATGFTNPADATAGEPFNWIFRTSPETAEDYTITGLPPGVTFTFNPRAAGGYQYLAGSPSAGGTYQVTIIGWRYPNHSGGSEAKTTYNLVVNVATPATPWDSWREAQGWTAGQLADPAVSGPDADPEHDGIPNSLEYVLDLDPRAPSSMPGKVEDDPTSPATHYVYSLPLNPGATDATVGFEASSDLGGTGWSAIGPSDPTYPVTRTATEIRIRIPKNLGQRFIRLAASL